MLYIPSLERPYAYDFLGMIRNVLYMEKLRGDKSTPLYRAIGACQRSGIILGRSYEYNRITHNQYGEMFADEFFILLITDPAIPHFIRQFDQKSLSVIKSLFPKTCASYNNEIAEL